MDPLDAFMASITSQLEKEKNISRLAELEEATELNRLRTVGATACGACGKNLEKT